jgi:hypothetical protein
VRKTGGDAHQGENQGVRRIQGGQNLVLGDDHVDCSRAGLRPPLSAQQVRLVRQIIEGLGLAIASPDEAREILELKGGDRVDF